MNKKWSSSGSQTLSISVRTNELRKEISVQKILFSLSFTSQTFLNHSVCLCMYVQLAKKKGTTLFISIQITVQK